MLKGAEAHITPVSMHSTWEYGGFNQKDAWSLVRNRGAKANWHRLVWLETRKFLNLASLTGSSSFDRMKKCRDANVRLFSSFDE